MIHYSNSQVMLSEANLILSMAIKRSVNFITICKLIDLAFSIKTKS